jgi:hypothetical protein
MVNNVCKEETESHYMFWVYGYNPITMYQEDNVSRSERTKRNKITWNDK